MANAYFQNISDAVKTLSEGLKLTFRHILSSRKTHKSNAIMHEDYFDNQEGIATIQYPHESLPVPDNARYRLHNEIDDCIVCDKCAKICPVDCIDIEAIRSPEVFGTTSDGTSKRIHAARFDIDMGKCCFCGLCTTVCPTECLTMTKTYDFSEFDVDDHIYEFATMTPLEILERKELWEKHQADKATPETDTDITIGKPEGQGGDAPTPKVKPRIQPKKPGDVKKAIIKPKPIVPKKPGAVQKPVIKPKPIVPKKPRKDD